MQTNPADQAGPPLRIADTSGQDEQLQRASRGRWPWLAGAVALLLAGWLILPAAQRWLAAEVSVQRDTLRLATVVRGDLVRDVSVQGRVVAAVSPTLYAADDGTVTFLVDAGDAVRKGDLLATIDSPELTNRLAQEQSSHARAEVALQRQGIEAKQRKLENQKTVDLADVTLTAAKRESRRADQAFEKDAISAIDYEKAHDEHRSAELAYEHAVADAALDNERLDFELQTQALEVQRQALLVEDLARQVEELSIFSPVNGIVGNLLVDQKTAVSRNQPVLAVVDLSEFEIEAEVPESYSEELAVGLAAEVQVGSARVTATLVAVSPEIISNQVTVRLRFNDAAPPGLRQNQRLTTRVLLEEKSDVLTVARGQFLESGGGRIAYVVTGDDLATKRSIEIGGRSLSAVEVLSGLAAGETIVVSNTERFEGVDTVLISD